MTAHLDTAHCESNHDEPVWAVALMHLSDSTSAANVTAVCDDCLAVWLQSWLENQARGAAEAYEIRPLAVGGCPAHDATVGPHHDTSCPLWDCETPELPTEGGAVEGTTGQGCSGGETAAEIRAGVDSREVEAVVPEALPAPEEGGTGQPSAGAPPGARSVLQPWVEGLTLMQQSVLLTGVRGPDGLPKYHPSKYLLRWYRRCILRSSFLGTIVANPWANDGGSFLGASVNPAEITQHDADGPVWEPMMDDRVTEYLAGLDEVPHHFQLHLMHAVEIVGYKHPDERIRSWWQAVYERLVYDMHLWPESEQQLDARLGDSREGWLRRADRATVA
jgi:hypothetical protein